VSAEASLLDYAEPQPDFMSEANKVASQRFNDSAIQPERSENDPFLHEIALCFVTSKGLVIISCCSHHGALNTIASCMEFTGCNTLHAYIGGLHFVDSPQVEAETTSFIGDWLTLYPNAHLYTGHCTCPRAATMLKALIPHCHTFYTGKVVEV
jgi:7,8-dihydropterin-6-yl-methyl-4-(beta-D-ribofuranosyl)aminobenzene 5'-phosphate synthase